MLSNLIIFEDVPAWDSISKYILGGVIAAPFIVAVVLLRFDITGAAVMFGITVLDALIIWMVLPKRFEVYEDRLRIILGWPAILDIPFRDITEVRQATSDMAYVYWGMRFATSSKFVVEIRRNNGMNVIISPSRGEEFIEQLNQVRGNRSEPGAF
jgi:hypothetical protein